LSMPKKTYFSFKARGISTPVETQKAKIVLMKKMAMIKNALCIMEVSIK